MRNKKEVCFACLLIILFLPPVVFAESDPEPIDPGLESADPVSESADPGFTKQEIVPPDIMKRWSIRITGSLKNETAMRVSQPIKVTKIKNQFILAGSGKISDHIRFKMSGRAYYDPIYDFTGTFGRNVRSDQGSLIEWRDTYLDLSYGAFDARLGNQQVVWGEAVALFYADVVNARDLREFILPDFDMIRIPQWGVDLEYSYSNFHAEFVYLPDVEFDRLGVSGSEFAFLPPLPSPATPFRLADPPNVNSSFKNGNVGGRLSYLWEGLDTSVFYYHTWTKAPVYFRSLVSGVLYDYVPEYRRLDIYGATFAKEFSGVVLKGEFVLNHNDYLPINDAGDPDGIVRRSTLNYLIGLDFTVFKKIDVNLQFMQQAIFNYTDALINEDPIDNAFALRLKSEFFSGKFEPEFTIVTSLMNADMMLRPKADFSIDKNWKWRIGSDIFYGKWNGLFGQFGRKSRVYSEITCNF